MRDFFINSLEKLVTVIVVVMILGTILSAAAMTLNPEGGILIGIAILIGGALYTVLMGGMLYLFIGIYQNTKKTAEFCAEMAAK